MPFRTCIFFLCLLGFLHLKAQPDYGYRIKTTKHICEKANVELEVLGTDVYDTLSISWSSGEKDTKIVYGLPGGVHSVNIHIKRHQDTLLLVKDTTFFFFIEQELCGVSIDKYFSPNDDNYHDRLGVTNTQYHPNFELNIFNKWGQRVHTQNKEYTPWDGKWNGIDLPDGTYFYVFFFDSSNKNSLIKGDITILR